MRRLLQREVWASRGAWNDRLEGELDNLRAAFDCLAGTAELRERGLQMASRLWYFCWVRGYVPEGRRWLERFLDRAEEYATVQDRAHAYYSAGVLTKESGRYAKALEYYEKSLELRRQCETEPGGFQADIIFAIAHVVRIQGDYAKARRLYEESLAINRRRRSSASERPSDP